MMKAIKMNMHKAILFSLCFAAVVTISACNEEDPFVDRVEAPVLLDFDEVTGYLASGGLTAVPSVTRTVTAANYANPVVLSLTVYELDKSGVLDHTVGIDSIPVAGVKIVFSKRDGTSPLEITSGSDGKVTVSTTWEALGVTDVQTIATSPPARSITISLTWTGEYKGQPFARYSQVVFSKAAS